MRELHQEVSNFLSQALTREGEIMKRGFAICEKSKANDKQQWLQLQ
jgi:hypothetical protein